jgi:hypothetical protein
LEQEAAQQLMAAILYFQQLHLPVVAPVEV